MFETKYENLKKRRVGIELKNEEIIGKLVKTTDKMNTLKERVLFLTIYPRNLFIPSPSIPYNLSLLGGVLKRNGIEVKIIDTLAEKMNSKDILKEIDAFQPAIVGFTSMTYQIYATAKMAESVKKWKKEIITVIGGIHASALPILTLQQFPFFDIAVINEGVDTIVEIVKADKKDWQKIKGIAFKDSSGINLTEGREFKKNIDDLPFPAYELLKLNKYTSYWTRRKRMEFPMFSSFGCPYKCTFCSRPQGNVVRYFSVERLMEEINRNIKEFDMSSIYFWDDTFTLNKKRVLSICEEILKRGYNKKVKWKCLSRIDTIDLEMLKFMKEAGCEHIEFGIESGNSKILETISKPVDPEKAEQVFQWCKEVGIRTRAFFIIGFPEETHDTLKDTYYLVWRLNPDFLTISILVPFPGTELFKYVDMKTLNPSKWKEYYVEGNPPLLCKNLSLKELKKFQISTYMKFYITPSRIFSFFMKPTGIIQTIKKAWQDISSIYFKKNEK